MWTPSNPAATALRAPAAKAAIASSISASVRGARPLGPVSALGTSDGAQVCTAATRDWLPAWASWANTRPPRSMNGGGEPLQARDQVIVVDAGLAAGVLPAALAVQVTGEDQPDPALGAGRCRCRSARSVTPPRSSARVSEVPARTIRLGMRQRADPSRLEQRRRGRRARAGTVMPPRAAPAGLDALRGQRQLVELDPERRPRPHWPAPPAAPGSRPRPRP